MVEPEEIACTHVKGKMGCMPRLSRPPGMPLEVETVIELIGNRARSEIVRTLARRGPLTASELAEAVGVVRSRVHVHITALEAQGLITGDVPIAARAGRTVRWALDTAVLERALAVFGDYLQGR